MMYRHSGGEPGFPAFFDRMLDRDSAGTCEPAGAAGEYLTSFSANLLTFHCKHKWLSFDFDNASGGEYFFSQRLWGICDGLNLPDHSIKAVRFVTMADKPAADSDYVAVRFLSPLEAVDPARSVVVASEKHKFFKVTKHLALDAATVGDLDLFRIKNMTLGAFLFCSDRFREMAIDIGAKLRFIPEEEAAEVYAQTINPLTTQ